MGPWLSPSPDWLFLPPPLTGAVVFAGAAAALLLLRLVLLHRVRRWSARTTNGVDDLLVRALDLPSAFWALALALDLTLTVTEVSDTLRHFGQRTITILLILSVTLVVSNAAAGGLAAMMARSGQRLPHGLGQGMVRALVGGLGAMVLLNSLGVEIAPLLTALGVGGLAMALALQDTLSNFFAGIHVLMERPFTIGDFIRLENGMEGTVLDISWRTTRLRTLQDHVVVLPNSKIAGSTLVNYHLPDLRTRLTIEVAVAFAADPERVREILLDEAKRVVEAEALYAPEPPPDTGITRLADSAMVWMVRFHVQDIRSQFAAVDLMYRRVLARLHREGIRIPYPTTQLIVRPPEGS